MKSPFDNGGAERLGRGAKGEGGLIVAGCGGTSAVRVATAYSACGKM